MTTAFAEPAPDVTIRAVQPAEAEARIGELAEILRDAVAHGASVNFLAGFTIEEARLFWRRQMPAFASGAALLLVADDGTRFIGTTILFLAGQPNGPHRAEIGKMLVHSEARRRGLGRRLLRAAEAAALAQGRTLLLLDTETGSAGDALYRACGWVEWGRVPGYALTTDGIPAEATFFMKRLA